MKFGTMPTAQAAGATLAHSLTAGGRRWRKGHLLDERDVAALVGLDVLTVAAAMPEPGDLREDEAAAYVTGALRVEGAEARPPATGRVNIHASHDGIFTVNRRLIDGINAVDPAITIATLPDFSRVAAGQMVATVKIIPFAVSRAAAAEAGRVAETATTFAVHPFRPHRAALIQTVLPGIKPGILDKTRRITAARLARSGSMLAAERRVAHESKAVAEAIAAAAGISDIVLVFGASAVCDREDVIPAAIGQAGGQVLRVGMPVDPGNLLVLGRLGSKPVIGAPGCARSPKENGFDWVLDRLCAGLDVSALDIAGMGVGGLLMEIPTRPQPRDVPPDHSPGKIHAVVLAAGRSSRMGEGNKLLARFAGKPLVRAVCERTTRSKAAGTILVTGHQADAVSAAVEGMGVQTTHNPDYASGLASSLKAGIAALPADAEAALIVLGDMPAIATEDLDRMIDAFAAAGPGTAVRATAGGKRGNPVILPRSLFADVGRLEGDIGARHLVESGTAVDVELGEGAGLDVDTPEALARAGGTFQD